MSPPIIVADLDNTLYNWKDYFAPSFRAMVQILSKTLEIDRDEIFDEFKRVYRDAGTLEFSWSVEALQQVKGLPQARQRELVELASKAFTQSSRKNLTPYAGVRETLVWAKQVGIRVIGWTNAPLRLADWRLVSLGLGKLFYGLGAWAGPPVPALDILNQYDRRGAGRSKWRSAFVRRPWEFSEEELKPSAGGLIRIINDVGVSPGDVYVVGDSLDKDIAPALQLGAIAVWAQYGRGCKPKNLDTLRRITHWTEEQKQAEHIAIESVTPTHTLDSFDELQNLIQPPQIGLPGFLNE